MSGEKPRRPKATQTTTVRTPIQAGMARRCHSMARIYFAPTQGRRHGHQKEEGQAHRDGDGIEEGRPHVHLLLGHRFVKNWIERPQEDDEGEPDEEQVVQEKRSFATQGGVNPTR